ncbi:MAG TPA: HIT family protein [Marinobacter adhaerens]|nr:HIT family protein [Pseudohongiella sp.]HBX38955.1 HIT family protein [Marinobacter adhaerens]|tara:strand:+ start:176 stop:598 length:423 start_codon:yes stop_codon:yes gene_type:complete
MSSLFTRIRQGELPGHLLWNDGTCFAILTIKPIREGHLLVIPHQEVDHWDDMDESLTQHVFTVSRLLSRTMRSLFPCEKVGMMIAGLEVRHAHIHLVPITAISDLNFSLAQERDEAAQRLTAARIRQSMRDAGHQHVPAD